MHQTRQLHWRFVIRLFKYIKTTQDHSLEYSLISPEKPKLAGFSDADYASDIEGRKSTSGFLFKNGGCLISWKSTKIVSLSTT